MRFLQTVLILAFLCTSVCSFAFEARPGSIKGTVKLSDGKPAAYVSVFLKSTGKGTVTGEDGVFQLRNISAGTYEIQVSMAGYQEVTQSVTVTEDAVATVSFTLNLSEQQLEEVTVQTRKSAYKTGMPSDALRLNEPLSQVPQNIQVVTGKAIADQQIISLSDGITRNVSGLTRLEHWGDMYTRINTRGRRASAFRNGMNITSPWGPLTEDMSFVDEIEFVKGPAGFMMSNGDPSGIYNVVTKRPTGQTKGEASLLLGSYDLYRSALDLDGKLSKDGRLLYRLNLMGQTKNSFRPYEYNDRYSIAPVISYKIDDNTTLTAEWIYQHAKMSNVGGYYIFSKSGYQQLPRSTTVLEPGLEPTVIDDHNITVNIQHAFSKDWKLTGQLAYFDYKQVGSSMWVGSRSDPAGYRELVYPNGDMVRNVSIWDASNVQKFGQVYLNGNMQTGSIQHRILGGLDMGDKQYMADWNQGYDIDKDTAGGYFNIFNPTHGSPANGYPAFDRSKSLRQRSGLYGQLTMQYTGLYVQDELGFLDNTIRLTLAGRYTYVKQNQYNTLTDDKRVTPRVGLSVNINKSFTAYALYDQSFNPQSGIRRDGKSIIPETGNNMEVGLKKDWFNGKWNTTLAAYRILINNQVSSDPTNTGNEFYSVQFGQTKTQGIEFDLRGQILPGLNVIANYAYTDSKISKADSNNKATIGNKVPGYAKHNANAWLTYRVQTGALTGFGANAGFSFQGDRTTWSWGATGQQPLPDYFKLDGGLTYEKDRFTITANVFNILNRYLIDGSYYGYGGYYYWQAQAGRNLKFGINYRF